MSGEMEVRVRYNGKVVATIIRPLRELDGRPAVTYKKQLWLLVKDSIEIGPLVTIGPAKAEPVRTGATPRGLNADGVRQSTVVGATPPKPAPSEDRVAAEELLTWSGDPIAEPWEARLIVDAGPGTGKTHAACARVASMVNDGVPATKICLVSFTRTAVVEMRHRIERALKDPADAAGVKVITLDALAWRTNSGFSQQSNLTGSYEDNIAAAHRLIVDDSDVADDVARIEHLIVDEAQDIVGARAELLLALIDALEPESGVTVFADRAQAIYGFLEAGIESPSANFIDALTARGFRQVSMTQVHRTSDPQLITIFTSLRRELLVGARPDMANYVRAEVARLAHGDAGDVRDLDVAQLPANSLVLLRNRFDVLLASSRAGLSPHRLRLSGMPVCVRAWVGQMFWDYMPRRISRDEFEKRWSDRDIQAPHNCEQAWSRCSEVAGESASIIDLHLLRKTLSRSTPPMPFCTAEFGTAGPILGTIHANKGRESDIVRLFVQDPIGPDESGEELRVLFVGATRAREQLLVGKMRSYGGSNLNGRAWRRAGTRLQVEVGRPLDIEPSGLVGRRYFKGQEGALAAQQAWFSTPMRQGLVLRAEESLGWKFSLSDGDQRLAGMSERFRAEMMDLASLINKRINWFGHGRSIGLRTMVVGPDSPQADQLLEPWRSSGFLFCPLLSALSVTKPRSL
ncbi:UvrD-helicase domain-containing protein [Stenotrophomonas sp. SORGH_AS_0282]|uniref:UvrD-helicase domain-containing protein n=2 Tax=Stenotrophomonas sp. SORGH_AS_0282 TaxID=3041763 RepID=UPI0027809F04|nr:UvrD-helicase domain-containing protein [Stenotrophomonas sp. SORGH_AS_0282]MDQ1064063.1 hypothetical protein [Stenotrophomonas sp. SORGH_AS_0282]MDQ1187567.1 hypothetical protein [Stenotrophomonas sp. SORGH_AS_0282]